MIKYYLGILIIIIIISVFDPIINTNAKNYRTNLSTQFQHITLFKHYLKHIGTDILPQICLQ